MKKSCDFVLGASDAEVTGRLRSAEDRPLVLDRRFTQEEDFFLLLDRDFVVEPFEIHHEIGQRQASGRYLQMIRSLVYAWTEQLPAVFHGMSWFFDPKDLFHPLFVQVLTARERRYLYLMRPDLTFRARHGKILDRGDNDITPRYSTRSLFLEAEVLPLDSIEALPGGKQLTLSKLFPLTWQGESGRGYFITGRWIDQEITRLLSRAAFAPGTKVFPYYPLRCRYETLSSRCTTPTIEGRRRAAAALEAAWPLVSPWADRLQAELKTDAFREDHPLVGFLRDQWNGRLQNRWGAFRLEAYLSETDQKEYRYYGD